MVRPRTGLQDIEINGLFPWLTLASAVLLVVLRSLMVAWVGSIEETEQKRVLRAYARSRVMVRPSGEVTVSRVVRSGMGGASARRSKMTRMPSPRSRRAR